MKATLRRGLPYGWWRSGEVWAGVVALVSGVATLLLLSTLVLVWWGLV